MDRATQYNKFIVSIIMGVLMIAEDWFGWSFGFISEEWVITTLAIIWPILVAIIPNQTE